jgi:signal transduction histidine kinase
MAGTIVDVTSRKQAEVERERLIQELETKNDELEQFTYTVSHDLKSPLITISGFLGYLEEDAVAGNVDRVRNDSRRIHEAVSKMRLLLDELLELSRIGRMMNPPEEVSFEEIVREALDNVHGRIEERSIAVKLSPNLPTVYGDRRRLVEVLQNLIDNAAKFMGDQPEPVIEIGQQKEENSQPIFYIRDNGIGIASEHHERIFSLFERLDPDTDGTGIGLTLVKRIIEFHGGKIWMDSEPGRGTAFYFTLSDK